MKRNKHPWLRIILQATMSQVTESKEARCVRNLVEAMSVLRARRNHDQATINTNIHKASQALDEMATAHKSPEAAEQAAPLPKSVQGFCTKGTGCVWKTEWEESDTDQDHLVTICTKHDDKFFWDLGSDNHSVNHIGGERLVWQQWGEACYTCAHTGGGIVVNGLFLHKSEEQ